MRLQILRRPTGATRRMGAMRVGVIDVGSNTVRLLVATRNRFGVLKSLDEQRAVLRLGEDVERFGRITETKLAEAADCVASLVRSARASRAELIEVLIASPGRQSENGEELRRRLRQASGSPVHLLDAEEEGRYAFIGAISSTRITGTIAVCDFGGGSTQITIGSADAGPSFSVSVDIGSLRLTRRLFADDPPGAASVVAAQAEVARIFGDLGLPRVDAALAVGGTARALRRIAGRKLSVAELGKALAELSQRPAAEISSRYEISPARAATLTAGAVIVGESQRRLGVPLQVERAGLREGAASTLLARLDQAA